MPLRACEEDGQHPVPNCRPGVPFQNGVDCYLCWLFVHKQDFRTYWGGEGPAFGIRGENIPYSSCIHLGEELGSRKQCGSCRGTVMLKEYACNLHGKITLRNCNKCKDKSNTIRIDSENFLPEISGFRLNGSITEYKDGYVIAFRNGWNGSEIFVCEMTKEFKPKPETVQKLKLRLRGISDFAREDPRLFWFQNKLHIMFIGFTGSVTHVLYAKLKDDFSVERIYIPQVEDRKYWEKNWQFFEHENTLHCVYTINPHRILRFDECTTKEVANVSSSFPWEYGEPRGGASPVKVGDEYWCFFHSSVEMGDKTYYMGLYTFSANPPFEIKRIVSQPIRSADWNNKPSDQYCAAVFPGGAVKKGDNWIVMQGIHDRWIEINSWSHKVLDSALKEVK